MEEADDIGITVDQLGEFNVIERTSPISSDTVYTNDFEFRLVKLKGGGYAIIKEEIQ